MSLIIIYKSRHRLKIKVYGHCQDNVVAALGKIIQSQSDKIDLREVIQVWLEHLPLKFDKEEARVQHELLADILLNRPELLAAQAENFAKAFAVLADTVNTKYANEATNTKVKSILAKCAQDPAYAPHFAKLSDAQQKKLHGLVS